MAGMDLLESSRAPLELSDIQSWGWGHGTRGQLLGALGWRSSTHGVRGGHCFPLKKQEEKWEKNLYILLFLFHFGTSSCIQVKEWEKTQLFQAHKGWSLFLFLSLFPVSCRSSSLLVLTKLSGLAELKNHLAATFMPGLKIISNWKVFCNCCNNLGYLALSRVYIWFVWKSHSGKKSLE